MPFIGTSPVAGFKTTTKQSFSGDNSTTAFTLNRASSSNTDFGTDILTSEGITPPENIFRKNENTLKVDHTISHNENALAAGPLTVDNGITLTVEGNLTIV